jgi:hypothetical protein
VKRLSRVRGTEKASVHVFLIFFIRSPINAATSLHNQRGEKSTSPSFHELRGQLSSDCKNYTFSWKGSSRPHILAEPSLQFVNFRVNRDIWHRVEGKITIEDGGSPKVEIKNFTGSDFPSHRLFLDGNINQTIQQGDFVKLWSL